VAAQLRAAMAEAAADGAAKLGTAAGPRDQKMAR
jgi:hypothetical protein